MDEQLTKKRAGEWQLKRCDGGVCLAEAGGEEDTERIFMSLAKQAFQVRWC